MLARAGELRFFVDETSLGLGKALAIARRDVVHTGHPLIPEVPIGALDTTWIPAVAGRDLAVISRDRHIRTKPGELLLLRQHGLRVFWISGKARPDDMRLPVPRCSAVGCHRGGLGDPRCGTVVHGPGRGSDPTYRLNPTRRRCLPSPSARGHRQRPHSARLQDRGRGSGVPKRLALVPGLLDQLVALRDLHHGVRCRQQVSEHPRLLR